MEWKRKFNGELVEVLTPWGLFTGPGLLDYYETLINNDMGDNADLVWDWYNGNLLLFQSVIS